MKPWIEISWFLTCLATCRALDPDEDICRNPKLDSAVNAADGKTYIFKDQYFWRTKPLDINEGIVEFAKPIGKKWSDMSGPVIASFVLKFNSGKFATVLVNKQKWKAYYSDGESAASGSTASWPAFNALDVNTMFSKNLSERDIFVIHGESKQFLIYKFDNSDLSSPNVVKTGYTATTYDEFLWFIDDPGSTSTKSLKDLMEVKASLTYKNYLILMSDKSYCKVDLKRDKLEKKCELKRNQISRLLGCPLDLTKRDNKTDSEANSDDFWGPENPRPDNNSAANQSDRPPTVDNEPNGNSRDSRADGQSPESNPLIPIIISVIVIIAIVIVVAVGSVFVLKKRSQTNAETNDNEGSTKTLETVHSQTGQPIAAVTSVQSLSDEPKP